jgi:hypothetical protein
MKKQVKIYRLYDIDNNENLIYGTMAEIKKYAKSQINSKLPDCLLKEQIDELLKIDMVAIDFLEQMGYSAILVYTVTQSDFLKSKRT